MKDPTDKEDFSPEKKQEKLGQIYAKALEILQKKPADPDRPQVVYVEATTEEASLKDAMGVLKIDNRNERLIIELSETEYDDSGSSVTIEKYLLSKGEDGSLSLEATGKTPDVLYDMLNEEDVSEEDISTAIDASDDYSREQLHTASPTEMARLAEIIDLGLYGDDHFDFESFEFQYRDHLDELEDQEFTPAQPERLREKAKLLGRSIFKRKT